MANLKSAKKRVLVAERNRVIITRDTTAKFNKSGIISFNIPDKVICTEDAIVWLRLSMTGECFPKILNVRTTTQIGRASCRERV